MELKPCPFCGGKGVLVRIDHKYYVTCDTCTCRTASGYIGFRYYGDAEAEAIAAWNTRAERTCEVELRENAWGSVTRHCGNCGADLDCDTRNKQNYCPNCGAKFV